MLILPRAFLPACPLATNIEPTNEFFLELNFVQFYYSFFFNMIHLWLKSDNNFCDVLCESRNLFTKYLSQRNALRKNFARKHEERTVCQLC